MSGYIRIHTFGATGSMRPVGDIDDDGLPDFGIPHPCQGSCSGSSNGQTYLIFGADFLSRRAAARRL